MRTAATSQAARLAHPRLPPTVPGSTKTPDPMMPLSTSAAMLQRPRARTSIRRSRGSSSRRAASSAPRRFDGRIGKGLRIEACRSLGVAIVPGRWCSWPVSSRHVSIEMSQPRPESTMCSLAASLHRVSPAHSITSAARGCSTAAANSRPTFMATPPQDGTRCFRESSLGGEDALAPRAARPTPARRPRAARAVRLVAHQTAPCACRQVRGRLRWAHRARRRL